ncbi:MAG: hypothetical protein LAT56_15430 [Wenzhouxiangella sp.]|nr:hypothetical protein [Wenzhouxiangella sp.]
MSQIILKPIDKLPQVEFLGEEDFFLVQRKDQDEPVLLSSQRFRILVSQQTDDELLQRLALAEAKIEITSQQIQLKVSKEVFDGLNDTVAAQSTQITQNANAINLKAQKSVVDDLNGRVESAESSIQLNANQIALRVTQSTFNDLEGRVESAESSITQNANQIELRVTKDTYDSLEGRVESAEETVQQHGIEINARATKTELNSRIEEVLEALTPAVRFQFLNSVDGWTGNNADLVANPSFLSIEGTGSNPFAQILSLFIDADENPIVYFRARRTAGTGYGGAVSFFNGSSWFSVSLTEPNDVDEWNTYRVDLSDNENYTGDVLGFRVQLGEGAGDEYDLDFFEVGKRGPDALILEDLDGRVSAAESTITQNANQIALRVTQSTFNSLESRVETAESSITQNADAIQLRVTQSTFNTLESRVETAESSITQNANAIQLRVTQSTFNTLDQRVETAESSINQNASAISLRVTTSTFNTLADRVDSAESSITQNADAIQLRVTTSTFNSLASQVESNESSISQNANAINLRVTQTEFDSLGNAVSTNSSNISSTNNLITTEILADGKTRSRMTQDVDGFEFSADRIRSTNWNGSISSNGNISNKGSAGWAISKTGQASFQKGFIGAFVLDDGELIAESGAKIRNSNNDFELSNNGYSVRQYDGQIVGGRGYKFKNLSGVDLGFMALSSDFLQMQVVERGIELRTPFNPSNPNYQPINLLAGGDLNLSTASGDIVMGIKGTSMEMQSISSSATSPNTENGRIQVRIGGATRWIKLYN